MPETLIMGVVSKLSKILGFLLKPNSYGLKFAKFGLLNVFYAKVATDKYFGHIYPKLVRCFVNIVDRDFIPCLACNDWWLNGTTVFTFILNLLNK